MKLFYLSAVFMCCLFCCGKSPTEIVHENSIVMVQTDVCGVDLTSETGLSAYAAYLSEEAITEGDFGVYYTKASGEEKKIDVLKGDNLLTIRFDLKPLKKTLESWASIRKEFSSSVFNLEGAEGLKVLIANNENVIGAAVSLRLTLCTIEDNDDFGAHGKDFMWWHDIGVLENRSDWDTILIPFKDFSRPPSGTGIRRTSSNIDLSKVVGFELNLLHKGNSGGSISIKEISPYCASTIERRTDTVFVRVDGRIDTFVIADSIVVMNNDTIAIEGAVCPDSVGEFSLVKSLGEVEPISEYELLSGLSHGSLVKDGYLFNHGKTKVFSPKVDKNTVQVDFSFTYSTFGKDDWIQTKRIFKNPISAGCAEGIFLKVKVTEPSIKNFCDARPVFEFVVYDYGNINEIKDSKNMRRWKLPMDGRMISDTSGKEFEIMIPFDALKKVDHDLILAKSASISRNGFNSSLIAGFAWQIIALTGDILNVTVKDVSLYCLGEDKALDSIYVFKTDTLLDTIVKHTVDTIKTTVRDTILDTIVKSVTDTIIKRDSIYFVDTLIKKETVTVNHLDSIFFVDTLVRVEIKIDTLVKVFKIEKSNLFVRNLLDTIFRADTVSGVDSNAVVAFEDIITTDTLFSIDTLVSGDTTLIKDSTKIVENTQIIKTIPVYLSAKGFVLSEVEGVNDHKAYSISDSVDVFEDWGFYRTKYDTNTKANVSFVGDTMSIEFSLPKSFAWGNWMTFRWQSPVVMDLSASTGIEFDVKVVGASLATLRNTICDVLSVEDYDIHAGDYMWWFNHPASTLSQVDDWVTVKVPFSSLTVPSGAGVRARSTPSFNPAKVSAFEVNLVTVGATTGSIQISNIRTY